MTPPSNKETLIPNVLFIQGMGKTLSDMPFGFGKRRNQQIEKQWTDNIILSWDKAQREFKYLDKYAGIPHLQEPSIF